MTNLTLYIRLKGEGESQKIAQARKTFIQKQARMLKVSEAQVIRDIIDTYSFLA